MVGRAAGPAFVIDTPQAHAARCARLAGIVIGRGGTLDRFRRRPIGRCGRQRLMAGGGVRHRRERLSALVQRLRWSHEFGQQRRMERLRRGVEPVQWRIKQQGIVRRRRWRRLVVAFNITLETPCA